MIKVKSGGYAARDRNQWSTGSPAGVLWSAVLNQGEDNCLRHPENIQTNQELFQTNPDPSRPAQNQSQ